MNILEQILVTKRDEINKAKKSFPVSELRAISKDNYSDKRQSFIGAIRKNESVNLIAEIKKASPSKGVIRERFYPVEIARTYEEANAAAISVLTDKKYFQGDLEIFKQIKNKVNLPLLRKDFIIDEYQIEESLAAGASAVLLIVAALEPEHLKNLISVCRGLRLDALVEVHNENELKIALAADADIIGVNNRNLATFKTDIKTTFDLMSEIPEDVTVVSESGISERSHILKLQSAGVHAVLIGEALMRSENIKEKIKELFP